MDIRQKNFISTVFKKHRITKIDFPSSVEEFAKKLQEARKNSPMQLILASNYEIVGKKGEYAASQLFGMTYNEEIYEHGGDRNVDGNVGQLKMEVKSTNYDVSNNGERPHLIFFISEGLKIPADIYILMTIKGNTVKLIGWADRFTIIEKGKRADWFPCDFNGSPERWVVSAKDLNDTIYKERSGWLGV